MFNFSQSILEKYNFQIFTNGFVQTLIKGLYVLILGLEITLVIPIGFGNNPILGSSGYTFLPPGFLFFITIAQNIIHITNTNSTIL